MVLVNVSVMPHGAMLLDTALPELPEAVPGLHKACEDASANIDASKPDIIVLFTPHGICTKSKPTIYLNKSVAGNAGWNGFWETYSVCAACNQEGAEDLLAHLNKTPETSAAAITCFSKVCSAAIAWGEVVPLHFCKPLLESGTELIVCAWPQLRFDPVKYADAALAMGKRLQEFAANHPKRVALMFSCDLSHVHGESPDAGFIFRGDPALGADKELAQGFDAQIVAWAELLAAGNVVDARETLLGEQCMGVVEKAKSCGWPGFCAVQGCLEAQASTTEVVRGEVPTPAFTTQEELMARSTVPGWSGRVWAYAAPTYFGMMVATYDVQA